MFKSANKKLLAISIAISFFLVTIGLPGANKKDPPFPINKIKQFNGISVPKGQSEALVPIGKKGLGAFLYIKDRGLTSIYNAASVFLKGKYKIDKVRSTKSEVIYISQTDPRTFFAINDQGVFSSGVGAIEKKKIIADFGPKEVNDLESFKDLPSFLKRFFKAARNIATVSKGGEYLKINIKALTSIPLNRLSIVFFNSSGDPDPVAIDLNIITVSNNTKQEQAQQLAPQVGQASMTTTTTLTSLSTLPSALSSSSAVASSTGATTQDKLMGKCPSELTPEGLNQKRYVWGGGLGQEWDFDYKIGEQLKRPDSQEDPYSSDWNLFNYRKAQAEQKCLEMIKSQMDFNKQRLYGHCEGCPDGKTGCANTVSDGYFNIFGFEPPNKSVGFVLDNVTPEDAQPGYSYLQPRCLMQRGDGIYISWKCSECDGCSSSSASSTSSRGVSTTTTSVSSYSSAATLPLPLS